MDLEELKNRLKELSQSESVESFLKLLEEFDPKLYDNVKPWYYSGSIDYPAVELWEKEFDENSIVVASNGTEGSGRFVGYRYYRDILDTFCNEVQISFMGIFIWRDLESNNLPEFFLGGSQITSI